jgi:hypothetical protein
MDGRIVAVLETWPLQLTVKAATGCWHVVLSDNTTVMKDVRRVEPSCLHEGQRILVTGKETSLLAMIAERIDLLL